jgi:hypothetical protein
MKILEEELKERYASKSYIAPGWWVIEDTNFTLLLQAQAELTRAETLKDQFSSSHYIDTGDYYKEDIPDSSPIEYPYLPDKPLNFNIKDFNHREFIFGKDGLTKKIELTGYQSNYQVFVKGVSISHHRQLSKASKKVAELIGHLKHQGFKQIG